MRKLIMTAAVLAIAGPAFAADIAPKVVKAPVVMATGPNSGVYFGVFAGAAFAKQEIAFVTLPGIADGGLYPAGWMLGGEIGARYWGTGGGFIDIEFSGAWDNTRGTTNCMVIGTCSTSNSMFFTGMVEVGAALPALGAAVPSQVSTRLPSPSQWPIPISVPTGMFNLAPFVGFGVAGRDVNACVTIIESDCGKQWMWGWAADAGVLMPVASGVNLKLTYLYANFNKRFIPGGTTAQTTIFGPEFKAVNEQIVKASLQFALTP